MVNKNTTLLSKLYYDPRSSSPLLREALKKNDLVTRLDVQKFLIRQPTYTLHRKAVRKFKRLPTLASGFNTDWQSDLCVMADVKRYNKNYVYILVCIDVLSRKIYARPLKTKTSKEVISAFEDIFKEAKISPWVLYTDSGKEFVARQVQNFLHSKGIQHYTLLTSPSFHAGMVENANRRIKERLYRYFTSSGTYKWIDVLPQIISAINNSHTRKLKMSPLEVTSDNAEKINDMLWKNSRFFEHTVPKFRVGDRVRIENRKHIFQNGYLANFTNEIFTISKVRETIPETFRIKGDDNRDINGWFYKQELSKFDEARLSEHKIDKIVKTKKQGGETFHLVNGRGRTKNTIAG